MNYLMKPHGLCVLSHKSSIRYKGNLICYVRNDETPKGLSKRMEHTKRPIALACDEINFHVKGVSNYEEQMC